MRRARPVLIVSRDESTLDRMVGILRSERIPAHGVSTYGAAIALHQHVRVGAVVLDIRDEADWQGCVLLRRALEPSVVLLTLTSAADLAGAASRAQEIGCAGALVRSADPQVLSLAIDGVRTSPGRGHSAAVRERSPDGS